MFVLHLLHSYKIENSERRVIFWHLCLEKCISLLTILDLSHSCSLHPFWYWPLPMGGHHGALMVPTTYFLNNWRKCLVALVKQSLIFPFSAWHLLNKFFCFFTAYCSTICIWNNPQLEEISFLEINHPICIFFHASTPILLNFIPVASKSRVLTTKHRKHCLVC